jgi:rhodanese-related sulfurtransferase
MGTAAGDGGGPVQSASPGPGNGIDVAVSDDEAAIAEVDVEALGELLDGDAVELIDVRREYEWEGGRIAGARHIELNQLSGAAQSIPRDRPVVFYCRTGNRSAMAAEAFRVAGYDARNLSGGIEAWRAAGHPLEREGGEVRTPLPAS